MMKNILKFTVTGIVAGILMGCLMSFVSGGVFVVFFVGTLGLLVGLVLGVVHRNDPQMVGNHIATGGWLAKHPHSAH